jgi:hypothetical protein
MFQAAVFPYDGTTIDYQRLSMFYTQASTCLRTPGQFNTEKPLHQQAVNDQVPEKQYNKRFASSD